MHRFTAQLSDLLLSEDGDFVGDRLFGPNDTFTGPSTVVTTENIETLTCCFGKLAAELAYRCHMSFELWSEFINQVLNALNLDSYLGVNRSKG